MKKSRRNPALFLGMLALLIATKGENVAAATPSGPVSTALTQASIRPPAAKARIFILNAAFDAHNPVPTAKITADPSRIAAGASSTLTWYTQGADYVTLDGKKVHVSGSQTVTPAKTTIYHLVAKGPGGKQAATAKVTVVQPTSMTTPTPSSAELLTRGE